MTVPGPQFRSIQIAPRGDRIYTVEQRIRGGPVSFASGKSRPRRGSKSARARETRAVSRFRWSDRISRSGPTGKVLAVGDRTGQVTLLDTTSFAVLGRLDEPGKDREPLAPRLAFSPDGTELAVGSQQGTISLWSVAARATALRLHLPGHRGMGQQPGLTTHTAAGWPARVSTPSSKSGTLKSSIASSLRLELAD